MITDLEQNVAAPLAEPHGGSETRKVLRVSGYLAVLAILITLGVVFLGFRSRRAAAEALANVARASVALRVSVVHPQATSHDEELVLPGNIQAFVDAPIYARTHGYLKRWYFDIGAVVHQGQLLAEIETPEVDQQLAQARADLKSAEAI
jgi:multidrug efflux pump subunit AcrA (membrane-fusion protein)